jgi:hypothetical protein
LPVRELGIFLALDVGCEHGEDPLADALGLEEGLLREEADEVLVDDADELLVSKLAAECGRVVVGEGVVGDKDRGGAY